jgi:hypothetical protein
MFLSVGVSLGTIAINPKYSCCSEVLAKGPYDLTARRSREGGPENVLYLKEAQAVLQECWDANQTLSVVLDEARLRNGAIMQVFAAGLLNGTTYNYGAALPPQILPELNVSQGSDNDESCWASFGAQIIVSQAMMGRQGINCEPCF